MSKYIISKKMAIEMLAWVLGLIGTVALLDLII
jgi:hypothetical protein